MYGGVEVAERSQLNSRVVYRRLCTDGCVQTVVRDGSDTLTKYVYVSKIGSCLQDGITAVQLVSFVKCVARNGRRLLHGS